jgi:hypothetical protein
MAWIKVIHEHQASGHLADYYQNEASEPRKGAKVSNIQKVLLTSIRRR